MLTGRSWLVGVTQLGNLQIYVAETVPAPALARHAYKCPRAIVYKDQVKDVGSKLEEGRCISW